MAFISQTKGCARFQNVSPAGVSQGRRGTDFVFGPEVAELNVDRRSALTRSSPAGCVTAVGGPVSAAKRLAEPSCDRGPLFFQGPRPEKTKLRELIAARKLAPRRMTQQLWTVSYPLSIVII